jgi:hypothetical protein
VTQADRNQAAAQPGPARPVPEQQPTRSLVEQIIDKTIESLGASGEITATARETLRAVLLADRVPRAAEVTKLSSISSKSATDYRIKTRHL